MADKPQWSRHAPAAMVSVLLMAGSLAVPRGIHAAPPAGQMCPKGAYVIGFDAEGNIVCSGSQGQTAPAAAAAHETAEAAAAGACDTPACQSGAVVAAGAAAAPAAGAGETAPPADTAPVVPRAEAAPAGPAAAVVAAEPVIADIEPSSVVYGKKEVTITVVGAGFDTGTVVLFAGEQYTPAVNRDGTELEVTLRTGSLAMGRYPIKIVNGAGNETLRKKGLVVF